MVINIPSLETDHMTSNTVQKVVPEVELLHMEARIPASAQTW